MADTNQSLLRRILGILAEAVVAIYVVLDSIVAPLFRPLMRFLSSLQLVKRMERGIQALPPYVILVVMVVPFIIAELAKVFAVFWMSEGHFRTGMTIFIGAYVVSILVCERIFHAGKGQLMTIGWFATVYGWVMAMRDHILGWFRRTRVWKLAAGLRESAKLGLDRTRERLRAAFGTRPDGPQKSIVERR